MAKIVQKYLDNAGNEFDNEADADASNAFIESEHSIEAYIDFAGLAKAQAGLMRRHLAGYISFLNREDHGALVEAAAVRVEAAKAKAKVEATAERAAKKAPAPTQSAAKKEAATV